MTNLIEAFENGTFRGLGKPDRVIETVISKLFFYGDNVYKVYKHMTAFFGDFTNDRFRHEFYHDDFIWNNTMAPDVYTKLGYVKKVGEKYIESDHDNSDDYYIQMKRIDDSKTLLNLSARMPLSKDELVKITETMFERVAKLTEIKKTDLQDLFNTPYLKLDLQNLETSRNWLYMSPDYIPKADADHIIDTLKNFISGHPFFTKYDGSGYQASIDNHTGNIIFDKGHIDFIDSMPPMRIWKIQTNIYTVSRPATDIEVLLGKEYSDKMYETLERIRNIKIAPEIRAYYQTVAALIQAPYLKILKEDVLADKFLAFAKEKIKELK
jgi:aminoglycoside phosphotransferase family enzyme